MTIRYEYLIAVVVVILAFWVSLILYRVGREKVIKNVDFWRSKWKIVLFWFVILVLVLLVLYLMNRYNLGGWTQQE